MALPMRRFTLLTIIGLLVLLTGATVYQVLLVKDKPGGYVGPGLSPGRNEVILLNLVGMPRESALESLRDAGLLFEVEPVGDGDGDTDEVVTQDPPGGVLIEEGSIVRLEVECVPAPCPSTGEPIADPCGCETD